MSELRQRILPHPVLSLTTFVVWLLLWDSLLPGIVLLGVVVAVGAPVLTRRFWPDAPEVQRFLPLFTYLFVFFRDILVANFGVAALVLYPNSSLRPTFLEIPLDINHPFLITILANTISLTPGTVSTNVAGDRGTLLVHCLHCEDPDEEIRKIKERYESRLQEMFA